MRAGHLVVVLMLATPQLAAAQHAISPVVPGWAPFAGDTLAASPSAERSGGLPALRSPLASDDAASSRSGKSTATLIGAGVGFLAGAGITWAILHSGGSTAICDRGANQDAIRQRECLGITVLGGGAGALLGALIGRWSHRGG
jgi:hypothetical protein